MTDESFNNMIHRYLLAKETAEYASKLVKEMEKQIKETMIQMRTSRYEYEEIVILLIHAERRSFDTEALKNLVSSSVFKTVTTAEIQTKMFDAAVAVGMISADVSAQIISKIPYTQLRIGKKQNGTR